MGSTIALDWDSKVYRYPCPHCGQQIEVPFGQINCTIFRCGAFKNNGQQINQHMPKELADQLVQAKVIYGCGKQHTFDGKSVQKCEGK
jgi:phage terminase large subunit GpA-like protein